MLRACFDYLATPASWRHRRLGFLGESVALQSRARRCRAAWAPHLARTRAAIEAAARACLDRRRVVVLGSGLLGDVPLQALVAAFDQVVLVDAVHPLPARREARRHANVALATADLAGVAGDGAPRDPLADLGAIVAEGPAGLVVSANILSQLPILPLHRCGRDADPGLGARIVRAHLAALPRLGTRICLVTDVDEAEIDRQGAVRERYDLLHGVPLGEPDRCWDWELAPFGEASRHRRLVHAVVAFLDWPAAPVPIPVV